jgi:hypothetical protein
MAYNHWLAKMWEVAYNHGDGFIWMQPTCQNELRKTCCRKKHTIDTFRTYLPQPKQIYSNVRGNVSIGVFTQWFIYFDMNDLKWHHFESLMVGIMTWLTVTKYLCHKCHGHHLIWLTVTEYLCHKCLAVPAPLVTPTVLLLLQTRWYVMNENRTICVTNVTVTTLSG